METTVTSQPSLRKMMNNSMKKTYETPRMTVVLIEHQCALLQPSDGEDHTPGIGKGIAMDSIEQPHNG